MVVDGTGERRTRILLAEDHDDLAALVGRKLKDRGWSVVRVRTAGEALPRIRGDRFDAVILDYRLPDGTGLDLLGAVRENAPSTPVLFLTAHGSEEIALQALALGATDYMQKTGSLLAELPSRIEGLLSRGPDLKHASSVVLVPARTAPDAQEHGAVDADHARRALEDLVREDVHGAAFFDGAGQPIAALLPTTLEPRALGLALVQVHAQAVLAGRTMHLSPRSYTFMLDTAEGVIASTGIAGRALACVLVAPGSARAAERLSALAARLR